MTWALARDAGTTGRVAVGAGILTAVPVLSLVYMTQPDNFSLYQPLVVGAMWMGARGLKGSAGSFVLAGLLAGLATLSRNDGLLVLGALGIAFLWDRWSAWRSRGGRVAAIPLWAALACVGVFVLVMAPWWLRQLAVFGSLSPSTASGKVLYIRDIGEWNSISIPASLDHLLGMGAGPLLMTRVAGFVAAVTIYTTLVLGLRDIGGVSGLYARLAEVSTARGFDAGALSHSWQHMGSPAQNPMGVEAFGLVMGLGFVLSFGYWCTDFLVVQRAMAAESMNSARRTPLIAAFPKMLFPFLIIVPGMIAIALTYAGSGFSLPKMADGSWDYTMVIP